MTDFVAIQVVPRSTELTSKYPSPNPGLFAGADEAPLERSVPRRKPQFGTKVRFFLFGSLDVKLMLKQLNLDEFWTYLPGLQNPFSEWLRKLSGSKHGGQRPFSAVTFLRTAKASWCQQHIIKISPLRKRAQWELLGTCADLSEVLANKDLKYVCLRPFLSAGLNFSWNKAIVADSQTFLINARANPLCSLSLLDAINTILSNPEHNP